MTRKILPILLLTSSLILSACGASVTGAQETGTKTLTTAASGAQETTATTSKSDADTVSRSEYEALKTEKDAEIFALTKEVESLRKDSEVIPDNSALAFKDRPAGMLYFPIYTMDEDLNLIVAGYAAIKPQAELSDKLDELTASISRLLFDGRMMEVTEIKTEDGKKVVYVDLMDASKWNQLFQGSTNGGTHSNALVSSYLQKDFLNDWIDGVHFTLDGQPIEREHAPLLEKTQYRK